MIPTDPVVSVEEVLNVVSALDSDSVSLDEYLKQIAVAVSRLIDVDWTVITFLEKPGFDRILASSIDIGDAADQTYSLHGTVTERVINTGNVHCVSDTSAYPDGGKMPEGYVAYVGLPLND